jgi:hypothetical protein
MTVKVNGMDRQLSEFIGPNAGDYEYVRAVKSLFIQRTSDGQRYFRRRLERYPTET